MDVWIKDIPHLRSLFPAIGKLDMKSLERLASEATTADLNVWRGTPEPTGEDKKVDRRRGPNLTKRQSLLSYEEIREMRAQGKTMRAIAKLAGISAERVRQIANGECCYSEQVNR